MVSDGRSGIKDAGVRDHPVVSREEWVAARTAFLAREKEFNRRRDELSRERRALPWVKVDMPYVFDGPGGKETLAQLFGSRSQLVVYHFMFSPEWEEGCKHCSFWADHFDAIGVHLNHRDTTLVAVSRAPLAKIERFKQRMGWRFKWVSSANNTFNYDYQVSFTPEQRQSGTAVYNYAPLDMDIADREGASVFFKDQAGAVFHTYSTYARGIDMLNTTYHYLDLVPMGRDEGDAPQTWVEYHDRYRD